MSLANTLVASSVLATLAFTTASLAVSQLTLNSRLGNQKVARDLAESAASECLAQVLADPKWRGDSQIQLEKADGGAGRATFAIDTARAWGIPASTNNLLSDVSAISQFDGSSLPAASLQLISVGTFRGQRVKVVQLIVIPPFKYAMSSTGEIVSNGGLTVGSVESPGLLANGFDSLSDDQLQAGHIAGNHSGSNSITLNATESKPVYIKGEVDSAGGVQKTRYAKVVGGVLEHHQPVPLPSIPVQDYDPRDRSDVVNLEDQSQAHLTVDKPFRRKGNLKISDGLEMTRGYLYVDGDVDIYGGITGKGAIFATGSLKIHGVSTFGANNQQALIAKGDIKIEGVGRNSSTFQGVVYTEGNFQAKNLTLVGSLVANKSASDDPAGSQMTLDSCNVLYNKQVINNVWNSGFQPGQEPSNLNVGNDPSFNTSILGGNPKPLMFALRPKASDFYDARVDQYRSEVADSSVYDSFVLVPRTDGETQQFRNMDEAIRVLSNPNHGLPISIPPSAEDVEAVRQANLRIASQNVIRALAGRPLLPLEPAPSNIPTSAPEVITRLRLIKGQLERSNTSNYLRQSLLRSTVENFNDYYIRTRARWMQQGEFGFSFNPNQFISLSDKARRMTWTDE